MRLTPSHARFSHDKQTWDIRAIPSKRVWIVTVECEGKLVESFERERTQPANEVVKQVILDRFGEDYGLV